MSSEEAPRSLPKVLLLPRSRRAGLLSPVGVLCRLSWPEPVRVGVPLARVGLPPAEGDIGEPPSLLPKAALKIAAKAPSLTSPPFACCRRNANVVGARPTGKPNGAKKAASCAGASTTSESAASPTPRIVASTSRCLAATRSWKASSNASTCAFSKANRKASSVSSLVAPPGCTTSATRKILRASLLTTPAAIMRFSNCPVSTAAEPTIDDDGQRAMKRRAKSTQRCCCTSRFLNSSIDCTGNAKRNMRKKDG
mmetsp:Transcript_16898/g.59010  ORF Transcript_16898/g.59010 Transcript_16898/m.59010 type:complete len:253 (+) Transcript_16898:3273-4031(+)